ncbi:hypothetical protein ASPWEDRAFT_168025 [Aspergillus wentii DTO 134E9]|uniref:Uncharacterized protein n=1 Tax=Aspergillus wentii DTO 134E9 TaxID=1073089 RepID=A0A1L9RT33_ASPWE|nr:uncharacterized protein ASPWEDRAFT_168025 [Aspergillus wentii DTO 134E9]KAI9933751.1 hypothetical protein MW887_004823 [Aspergillus wentii]OJJ38092.1 hypothetical protein ASPWEDRAFT_168025 [Aspergillus wentii DTO 134E9]
MKISSICALLSCALSAQAFSIYYDGDTVIKDARRIEYPCVKADFRKGNNLAFFNDRVDQADDCHLSLWKDSKCNHLAGSSHGEWRKKLSENVDAWSFTC